MLSDNGGIDAFKKTLHLVHGLERNDLDSSLLGHDLDFLPRGNTHGFSNFFRNNNLILGRNRYNCHDDTYRYALGITVALSTRMFKAHTPVAGCGASMGLCFWLPWKLEPFCIYFAPS